MSNSDPTELREAIEAAEDAFETLARGSPQFEAGISRDEAWKTQLHKACRLLKAGRTLRKQDGYFTSVIEMSFAAIERTLEFYCLNRAGDAVQDFHDHETVYERVVEVGLYSRDTAEELRALYNDNRTGQYYGSTVSTRRQAEAMFELATVLHEQTVARTPDEHECRCA